MITKYFWPEKDCSWEELDIVTAKAKSLYSWPMAGAL
jgi:hypothetical protein